MFALFHIFLTLFGSLYGLFIWSIFNLIQHTPLLALISANGF